MSLVRSVSDESRGRTLKRAMRSRSTSRGRAMSIARPLRSYAARGMYNGEYKLTRNVNQTISSAAGTGFIISGATTGGFFITVSPTAVTLWANVLNSVVVPFPNISEVSALFDTVKIDKLELTISAQGSDQAGTVGTVVPRIYIANDYTDGTTGTTLDQVLQQGGCRFLNLSNDQGMAYHTCYPKHQRIIYYNAATSAYEPAVGFISSSVDVPHYGIRIATDASKLSSTGFQMNFKIFLSCKNVK